MLFELRTKVPGSCAEVHQTWRRLEWCASKHGLRRALCSWRRARLSWVVPKAPVTARRFATLAEAGVVRFQAWAAAGTVLMAALFGSGRARLSWVAPKTPATARRFATLAEAGVVGPSKR